MHECGGREGRALGSGRDGRATACWRSGLQRRRISQLAALGAVWLALSSVPLVGSSAQAAATGETDPVRVVKAALAERSDIREEDRTALREIALGAYGSAGTGLSYQEMSAGRRGKLAKRLRRLIEGFPQGEYSTPLQRHAKLENARMSVRMFRSVPVFECQQPVELSNQMDAIIDLLMAGVREHYSDLVGTPVESEVQRILNARLSGSHRDDMTTAFKVPLPRQQFVEYLDAIAQESRAVDPWILFPGGVFAPRWSSMDEASRSRYVEENVPRLARSILATFGGVVGQAVGRHAQYAMSRDYAGIDQTFGVSAEEGDALRELTAAAADERRAIRERLAAEARADRLRELVHDRILVDLGIDDRHVPGIRELIPLEDSAPWGPEAPRPDRGMSEAPELLADAGPPVAAEAADAEAAGPDPTPAAPQESAANWLWWFCCIAVLLAAATAVIVVVRRGSTR